jgi:hypothetical protein
MQPSIMHINTLSCTQHATCSTPSRQPRLDACSIARHAPPPRVRRIRALQPAAQHAESNAQHRRRVPHSFFFPPDTITRARREFRTPTFFFSVFFKERKKEREEEEEEKRVAIALYTL